MSKQAEIRTMQDMDDISYLKARMQVEKIRRGGTGKETFGYAIKYQEEAALWSRATRQMLFALIKAGRAQ